MTVDVSVAVTGLAGTSAVGSVTTSVSQYIDVTGVVGTTGITGVNVWSIIDDSQTPDWGAVDDAQTPDWAAVIN